MQIKHLGYLWRQVKGKLKLVAAFIKALLRLNHQVEGSIRLSEELFAKAFEGSPNPMAIATLKDGRYIRVNKTFIEISGFAIEEVIGKSATELNIWEKPEDRDKVILLLMQQGRISNLELNLRTKLGELRIGLFSAELIEFKGYPCVMTIVNDITELKRLQQDFARFERLNLVGQMAASIGHEIRNPITTVRGFLQLLGGRNECSEIKSYFELMIEELDRANMILTEYLSLAKNKNVKLIRQNLNNIIQTLEPLILADATKFDHQITMEIGDIPDIPLNEEEIRQLILNLSRNGLEAMDPGGTLNIKTYQDEKEIVLSIFDHGKGIHLDVAEKIGTPFFTTKEQGTGLGLAVCYSIAARHNASIDFETSSKGTNFVVRFKV